MDYKIGKAINKEYSQYPNKLITSDDIEKMGYKWFNRNTIPKKLNAGNYLLNLDSSTGEGTHWTLITISPPYLFYYDPFGDGLMSGYAPKEIDQLAQRMNLTKYESEYWQQYIKSWLCGYLSLFTAEQLDSYIGKLTIPLYKKIIYRDFGSYPDPNDIKKITAWSKNNNLL
jgi:hypothetical protein